MWTDWNAFDYYKCYRKEGFTKWTLFMPITIYTIIVLIFVLMPVGVFEFYAVFSLCMMLQQALETFDKQVCLTERRIWICRRAKLRLHQKIKAQCKIMVLPKFSPKILHLWEIRKILMFSHEIIRMCCVWLW